MPPMPVANPSPPATTSQIIDTTTTTVSSKNVLDQGAINVLAAELPSFSVDLVSNSPSSSSTNSDVESEGRKKRKWKGFFEGLAKEVIQRQEEMQKRFLEAIEKREHERIAREESWRSQEMARTNRERKILAQERSMASAKDAAVMAFLHKLSEQQNQPPVKPATMLPTAQLTPTPPAPTRPSAQSAPTPTPTRPPAQSAPAPARPPTQSAPASTPTRPPTPARPPAQSIPTPASTPTWPPALAPARPPAQSAPTPASTPTPTWPPAPAPAQPPAQSTPAPSSTPTWPPAQSAPAWPPTRSASTSATTPTRPSAQSTSTSAPTPTPTRPPGQSTSAQAPTPQAVRTISTTAPPANNGEQLVSGASSSRWPKVEIESLIKLRTNLDSKYQENGVKGPLWEEISAGMRKLGYNRNSKRCKQKWENINKYYKKVKESNKKRPQDSKTCPYFNQLDALYR